MKYEVLEVNHLYHGKWNRFFYNGWWLTRKSKVAGWAMPLFKAGHIGIFHGQAEVCHPRIDRVPRFSAKR
jgi:hypothetical protein